MEEAEASKRNLEHALENLCGDVDCEIHHPEVIETSRERWTAKAWFYAGACDLIDKMAKLQEMPTPIPVDPSQLIEEAMNELKEEHVIHDNWP